MNTITLVGRLATDPRLEPSAGNPICTFRLVVDRGRTECANFIPIKSFGTPAEQHQRYLTKGRLISITGRLSHGQWTDKDTGDNRERYEVIANQIGYLDTPAKDQPTEVRHGEEPFQATVSGPYGPDASPRRLARAPIQHRCHELVGLSETNPLVTIGAAFID